MNFSDSDLNKILYNVDEAGNLVGKNENELLLPRFPDMVMTVVDSNEQYDSSVLLEVVSKLWIEIIKLIVTHFTTFIFRLLNT